VTKPLLALARELDRAFEDVAHSDGDKREQLAVALMTIAKFLAEVISPQHANVLFELGSAIADLNSGAVHSLLDPPKDIARRDSSQTWRSRANAVLAVEALYATGSPLDLAAGDVLRMIQQHLGGEPRGSVGTLLTWRKEFSAGRVKNDEANELFAVGRELIQARCVKSRSPHTGFIARFERTGRSNDERQRPCAYLERLWGAR
jgi:hypothetical protein